MKSERYSLLIFDLENVQDDYSKCLEFILLMEQNIDSHKDKSQEDLNRLFEIRNSIHIKLNERDGKYHSPNYIEQPLSEKIPSEKRVEIIPPIVQASKDISDEDIMNILVGKKSSKYINYHIRIKLKNDSSIMNLQYLALLLQQLYFMFKDKSTSAKRLSVFIIPLSGDVYPFTDMQDNVDFTSYIIASRYLRLLSKDYTGVIYGVTDIKSEIKVTALDYKDINPTFNYFPLIPINKDSYHKLIGKISDEKLAILFDLKKNRRYGIANTEDPIKALEDFIAETSIRRFQYAIVGDNSIDNDEYRKICDEIFENIVRKTPDGNTLLTFAVFSFIICQSKSKLSFDKRIREVILALDIARNMSLGIKQAIQNVIQHSQTNTGVFSFYLHESFTEEENIIQLIHKSYPDTEKIYEIKNIYNKMALEIFISDLNYKETMTDNFLKNIKDEFEILGDADEDTKKRYIDLIEQGPKFAIRNLFDEYAEEDPQDQWSEFRKMSSFKHTGLKEFSTVAQRCYASVKVISNRTYSLQKDSLYFYRPYGAITSSESENDITKYNKPPEHIRNIIPGTQFSVLIPIVGLKRKKSRSNGTAQLSNIHSFDETYSGLSKFIDYKENRLICNTKFKNAIEKISPGGKDKKTQLSVTDRLDKIQLIDIWKDFFKDIFENILKDDIKHSYIYYIDFRFTGINAYFENTDNMEVFIKGLFEAAIHTKDKDTIYFGLTNVLPEFFERTRGILMLYPERMLSQKLQLFMHAQDCHTATIFGETVADAVRNEYMLSLEHGMGMFYEDDYNEVIDFANDLSTYYVAPFDAIIPITPENPMTIFDNKILTVSNNSMEDTGVAGYKISDTHMRLGSKVHLTGFYEMSFLFYRTNIANRFAFEIIKNLVSRKEDNKIDVLKDKLLFYGYASYSKAILTSLVEMLKAYRRYKGEKNAFIHFAAYQHNLQLNTSSDDIQMYFSYDLEDPKYIDDFDIYTKVIQIVPISSTLTTFKKMWSKFLLTKPEFKEGQCDPVANYTIFWVRDNFITEEEPTENEKTYWKSTNPENRTIKTVDLVKNDPVFFIKSPIQWHDPLKCDLCYPNDTPLSESPLVETDMTSTVPTQQIRPKLRQNNIHNLEEISDKNVDLWRENNNERIIKLKKCVYYGHIKRGKNHYQYYIDTQNYFHIVEDDVKKWLSEMAEKNPNINITNIKESDMVPVLNIIFTSEHNTNVSFAQYVNNYYFGGTAEVISINVDKEYRSNFICEHTGLINTVSKLLEKWGVKSVKFHFADDTIISGGTIIRANNLLQSLIPKGFKHLYPIVLFDKCFVLIDRLSNESKRNYVKNIYSDFLSFLHIDISSMRTQGDSCIGCKLQSDAKKLFKRSATRELSNYWIAKHYELRSIYYDNKKELKNNSNILHFERLIASHIAQNVIFNNSNNSEEDISNSIRALFYCVLDIKTTESIQKQFTIEDMKVSEFSELVNKIYDEYKVIFNDLFIESYNRIVFVQCLLKIIARPFFTYDFKVKQEVMKFLITLNELYMDNFIKDKDSTKVKASTIEDKVYTIEDEISNNIIRKIKEMLSSRGVNYLRFLQDYLIEPLSDIRSTYLIRKQTLIKVAKFVDEIDDTVCDVKYCSRNPSLCNRNIIECFWREYTAHIHHLIDCSSDESKSLWFAYLLLTGNEYTGSLKDKSKKNSKDEKKSEETKTLFECLGGKKLKHKEYFEHFCDEIFIINNRLMFDAIERVVDGIKLASDDYFMKHWKDYSQLRDMILNKTNVEYIELSKDDPQCALFSRLKVRDDNDVLNKDKNKNPFDVHGRYKDLLGKIVSMVKSKYKDYINKVDIALVTYTDRVGDRVVQVINFQDISEYDIIASVLQNDSTNRKYYEIKDNIRKAIDKNFLLDYGYYFDTVKEKKSEDNYIQNPYLLLYFDNPKIDDERKNNIRVTWDGRELKKIAHIFIYLDVELKDNSDVSKIAEESKMLEKFELQKTLIMRFIICDLLSYRNRLLRFFENDFAGDIYAKFAHTSGEKNILAHEKSYSHSTTTDDISEYEIISSNKGKKYILSETDEMKWLMFRSYTNRQVAKLFNRSFSEDDDKDDNKKTVNSSGSDANIYLYAKPNRYPERSNADDFMGIQLIEFKDLYYLIDGKKDNRGEMLQQIINFSISKNVEEALFINNGLKTYNLEYFKCLLCDVFFSALKYSYNELDDFISRIEQSNMYYQDINEKKGKRIDIRITRREGCECDYLVIENFVKGVDYNLTSNKYQDVNNRILRRLKDPLNHTSGHMSLYTIKHYIEGLKEHSNDGSNFYYKSNNEGEKCIFVTELPVLVKRGEVNDK